MKSVHNPRLAQTRRFWDLGFGRELNKSFFGEYLKDIPEIPESLKSGDTTHSLLVLVDPRLGLGNSCELIGIRFNYKDEDVIPFDDRCVTPQSPFWVRFHDGRSTRNRAPSECRRRCTGNVYASTAVVAIMAYCHFPDIIKEDDYVLDLPGSVHRGNRVCCAYLRTWDGRPKLGVVGDDGIDPDYGSSTFRLA